MSNVLVPVDADHQFYTHNASCSTLITSVLWNAPLWWLISVICMYSYNEDDQPVCRVCNVTLKSESLWPAHQASRKHHEVRSFFLFYSVYFLIMPFVPSYIALCVSMHLAADKLGWKLCSLRNWSFDWRTKLMFFTFSWYMNLFFFEVY